MSHEKQKTIEGAKWTVIIFSLTTILAFLTNLFLARISPEMVGYFTLMTVFISTITTFVFLGGGLVFPTLLPKIKSNLKKASFVMSYFVLVGILMTFTIGIFLLFPSLFDMFLKREVTDNLFNLLLLIIPFVLMTQFSQSLLNGLFEIKLSSIIEKLRTIVLFFALPIIYLIDTEFFKAYFVEILVVLTILSFTFGFRLSLRKIFGMVSFSRIKLFYFPKGFWSFMLTAQAMSILSYFFNNFDKLVVAQYFGVKELGIYSVIILIWTTTLLIPQLVLKTQLSLLSKYVQDKNKLELENLYRILNRYTTLYTILISFIMIMFSDYLLMMFGEDYVKYSYYLNLLLLTNTLLTFSYVTTPLLIALQYNKIRLFNSVIQILLQVVIMLLFLQEYRFSAMFASIIISTLIAQIYPVYIIFSNKEFNFEFNINFVIGFLLSIMILLYTEFINANIFIDLSVLLLVILLFLRIVKVNSDEVYGIYRLIKGQK